MLVNSQNTKSVSRFADSTSPSIAPMKHIREA